ncbi:MAG: putative glycosyltransferase [Candidatus Peregrinibacteria bacterium Gr01-1014_25]|nr:MAG: putative glycosyltransferase [Candidatus Peregrinibacteria bacterium Gr01-1014_25]
MRVALFSSTLDVRNGYGNITFELTRELCAQGIDAELFLPTSEQRFAKANPAPCPTHCVLPEYIYRIHQPRAVSYLRPLDLRGFDIVHSVFDFPYCVYAAWQARRAKRPFLMGVQGTYGVVPLVYWPEKHLMRWCYRQARRVIVPSQFTKDMIQQYAGEQYPIDIIHNGVRTDRFLRPADTAEIRRRFAGKTLLLTVGGLKERKGQDLVIRALPAIVAKRSDVMYVMVGEGFWQNHLEALARDLGVAGHVVFAGPQADDALVAWFQACDIYVHTPRVANLQFEGFGIVYLEAGACAKPSIATDAGGIRDAVVNGETGLIVPDGDVHAIAEATVRLCDDPSLRARLGETGRRYAAQHDWSHIAKRFIATYREVHS